MAKCRELKSIAEWETIFPLIQELRDHLSLEIFLKYAHPMHENGYHLFVIEENEVIMGVAGVAVLVNFYYGRHAFLYDLVVTSNRRSEGFGGELLTHIEEWAKTHDCSKIVLESGLWRESAH